VVLELRKYAWFSEIELKYMNDFLNDPDDPPKMEGYSEAYIRVLDGRIRASVKVAMKEAKLLKDFYKKKAWSSHYFEAMIKDVYETMNIKGVRRSKGIEKGAVSFNVDNMKCPHCNHKVRFECVECGRRFNHIAITKNRVVTAMV
jgi:hypothetical protein